MRTSIKREPRTYKAPMRSGCLVRCASDEGSSKNHAETRTSGRTVSCTTSKYTSTPY